MANISTGVFVGVPPSKIPPQVGSDYDVVRIGSPAGLHK
ncbi:hypothetical protein OROMI_030821 [Orobanche minor]